MESEYYQGIFYMIVANVIMITSNFVVRDYDIRAVDAILAAGLVKFTLSLLFIVFTHNSCSREIMNSILKLINKSEYNEIGKREDEQSSLREVVLASNLEERKWIFLFGICDAINETTRLAAIHFIPVSDFTLYATTVVIFTYIFGYFMIGIKPTILKTLPCLMLLIGISLTIKPIFIFSNDNLNRRIWRTGKKIVPQSDSMNDSLYWIGILISLTYSVASGIKRNIPKKCANVQCVSFLLWSGFCILVTGVVSYYVQEMQTGITNSSSLSHVKCLMIPGLGVASSAFHLLSVYANKIGCPVVNSVIRRSEILFVIFVTIVYFKEYPDNIEAIGYCIVLISVSLKIAVDKIDL